MRSAETGCGNEPWEKLSGGITTQHIIPQHSFRLSKPLRGRVAMYSLSCCDAQIGRREEMISCKSLSLSIQSIKFPKSVSHMTQMEMQNTSSYIYSKLEARAELFLAPTLRRWPFDFLSLACGERQSLGF